MSVSGNANFGFPLGWHYRRPDPPNFGGPVGDELRARCGSDSPFVSGRVE